MVQNPYTRMSDWAGDYKANVAAVFAGVHVLVRLTDQSRNPLPGARCHTDGSPATRAPTANEKGVAKIRLPKSGQGKLEILWQPPSSRCSRSYFWYATFHLGVESMDDESCQRRLQNLGFDGPSLEAQVAAYQTYLGRMSSGRISDIRAELAGWHDGGDRPGVVPAKRGVPEEWLTRLRAAVTDQTNPGRRPIDEAFEVFDSAKRDKQVQIRDLKQAYANRFKSASLEDEIYNAFDEAGLKRVLPLYYDDSTKIQGQPQEWSFDWTDMLDKAFNYGNFLWTGGTDEDKVFEVLSVANTSNLMLELACDYNDKFGPEKTLEYELYDELSGDDLKKALRLYYGGLAAEARAKAQQRTDLTNDEPPAPLDAFCHGTLVPRHVVLATTGWRDGVDAGMAAQIQALRQFFGSATPFGCADAWFPPLPGDKPEDLWQRMKRMTELIEIYDKVLPWEDKTDLRDFLAQPLMHDIVEPILRVLGLRDWLKEMSILQDIPSALKDAINSLLEGTTGGEQSPLTENQKQALQNLLKAIASLTSTRKRPGKPDMTPPWDPSNVPIPTQSLPVGPGLPTLEEPTWIKFPVIKFP